MNEDDPQITPEDFGRRFAEAAIPPFIEALQRTLDTWSDQQRAEAPSQKAPAPALEWKGGRPTEEQLKTMSDKSDGTTMDRLIISVDEIKNFVSAIAANQGVQP